MPEPVDPSTPTGTPVYRLGRRVPAHIFAMVGSEPSDDDIPLLTLPPELVHLGPGIVERGHLTAAEALLIGVANNRILADLAPEASDD